MGKTKLYGTHLSPPVRAVLLTCKAINLDIEFIEMNLINQDHKKDEFVKKNPQHTIPLLEDDGKFIWDSHAICTYLIGKYGKNDSLYPKDLYQRALVDQRLHFDSGILFIRLRTIVELLFKNIFNVPQELIDRLYEAYDFVEKFLQTDKYIVGNSLTVADFCCIASISSMQGLAPIDPARYPKLNAWIKRIASELPYYQECNANGAQALIGFINGKLASK